MKGFFILPISLLLFGCTMGGGHIDDIKNSDNFFLCFPETEFEFSSLELIQKVKLQKVINLEKRKRNLDCSDLRVIGAENSLKKINNDEMDSRLGKCDQRSGPCIYK